MRRLKHLYKILNENRIIELYYINNKNIEESLVIISYKKIRKFKKMRS